MLLNSSLRDTKILLQTMQTIEESLTSKIKIEGHVTHLEVAKDLEKIFVVENVKHLIFKGEKL